MDLKSDIIMFYYLYGGWVFARVCVCLIFSLSNWFEAFSWIIYLSANFIKLHFQNLYRTLLISPKLPYDELKATNYNVESHLKLVD